MSRRKEKDKNIIALLVLFLLIILASPAHGETDIRKLRDPFFSPLWKWQLEKAERLENEKNDPKKITSALEIYDLTELKLVGIIASPTGNKAVIETPDNKAFFLVKGTVIGKNDGVITDISEHEVIISEIVFDYLGNEQQNIITLKIEHPEDKEG
ncbi:MAG: pilus assembly protein PilP [bacterium]